MRLSKQISDGKIGTWAHFYLVLTFTSKLKSYTEASDSRVTAEAIVKCISHHETTLSKKGKLSPPSIMEPEISLVLELSVL